MARSSTFLTPPLLLTLLLSACVGTEDDKAASPEQDCSPGFITVVESISLGERGGYGKSKAPDILYGPPQGSGTLAGSTDVVSLGLGGEVVVRFAADIANEPGADFLVFENAFWADGDPSKPYAELGEVSVSADGVVWHAFPCAKDAVPYAGCAGVHPVLSDPDNGISPFEPALAGGEAYDLADVGLSSTRLVRVRDVAGQASPNGTAGFDLDAMVNLHPACP